MVQFLRFLKLWKISLIWVSWNGRKTLFKWLLFLWNLRRLKRKYFWRSIVKILRLCSFRSSVCYCRSTPLWGLSRRRKILHGVFTYNRRNGKDASHKWRILVYRYCMLMCSRRSVLWSCSEFVKVRKTT